MERSRSSRTSRAPHLLPELSGTVCLGDERLLPTRLGSVDPRRGALAGVVRLRRRASARGCGRRFCFGSSEPLRLDERFAIHPSVRDGRTGRMLPPRRRRPVRTVQLLPRDDRLACHRSRRVARAFTRNQQRVTLPLWAATGTTSRLGRTSCCCCLSGREQHNEPRNGLRMGPVANCLVDIDTLLGQMESCFVP